MNLVVGLGNPGQKYTATRHNIGFFVVDKFLASKTGEFANFKNSKKFKAEVTVGQLLEEKIILAKPQTYMNDSGSSIASLVKFYKIKLSDLVIIHDDIDLPVGKIRISQAANSGGHKGVQDIIDKLGSNEFIRLRIGINLEEKSNISTEDFVLQNFTEKENKILQNSLDTILEALDIILTQGPTEAMNLFN